jgi:hypothetical protein
MPWIKARCFFLQIKKSASSTDLLKTEALGAADHHPCADRLAEVSVSHSPDDS